MTWNGRRTRLLRAPVAAATAQVERTSVAVALKGASALGRVRARERVELMVGGGRSKTGAIAVGVTAAVLGVAVAALADPDWLFVDNAAIRAASETLVGLAAVAACWIALLRAERTRSSSDLALAVAIGIVFVTSTLLTVLTVTAAVGSNASASWFPVPGRVGAAALMVAAGSSSRSLVRLPGRPVLVLLIGAIASLLAGCGALLGVLWGVANVPLWIQLGTITVYLAGALALTRRARRTGDGVVGWYAAAAAGLAGSRLTFMLLPPPGSHWLSPGDLVRLAVGAFLLMAVKTELTARRNRAFDQAIAEERGRMAREIHDGMAQELAFIVSQSQRLIGRSPDSGALEPLAAAGKAALAEARRAIFNLKRPSTRSLSTAIVEQTFLIATRARLALDVEVEGDAAVGPEIEHAILCIVKEAVSNAARHAAANTVSIRIASEDDRVVVRISDDGDGFEPRALNPRRGFGLRSMSHRAESLGGRLLLESEPGSGTMIEVAI
jgi:signal transduction histidine kinase